MPTASTALLDACVLHPSLLRDLLLQLATTGLFRARWTEDIHEEWIKSVLERRPDLARAQLQRTRELMDAHAPDCLVTEYEALIPSLVLPDSKDRHVLAAAIRGRADVIVTFNTDDFPQDALDPYDIDVQHPDEFLVRLCNLSPAAVTVSARECRARLKKPPFSVDEYLAGIAKLRLPETSAFLSEHRTLV
ncbi:MAG: PIN domain-containing protein [Verrucomicrobia bacterium]|nr:PIN domain-containing protein [Verrucomicrobiota bacterium]